MSTGSRASLLAGIALLAAMLVGGAGGFFLGRQSVFAQRRKQMTVLGLSRSELLEPLALSAAQRATIDSLLDDATRRADSSISDMMTGVRTATRDARRAVRDVLDPRQQQRFDSILASVPELRPRSPLPPRR